MTTNQNQRQSQCSLPEDSEWSSESRQQWVSLAIAAATASLRASAPSANSTDKVELKTNSA